MLGTAGRGYPVPAFTADELGRSIPRPWAATRVTGEPAKSHGKTKQALERIEREGSIVIEQARDGRRIILGRLCVQGALRYPLEIRPTLNSSPAAFSTSGQ